MTYKVISPFVDRETGKEYSIGDEYKSKSRKRLEALSTGKNLVKTPLIEKVTKSEENGDSNND